MWRMRVVAYFGFLVALALVDEARAFARRAVRPGEAGDEPREVDPER